MFIFFIKDNKYECFLGTFCTFLWYELNSTSGFIMLKAINELSSTNPNIVTDDGLGFNVYIFTVGNGIALFLKNLEIRNSRFNYYNKN